ncbi:ABC transporter ATP-binding protein [Peredibacter starrii]|uniref:ABC transporter ATP-binding protein n=1 Tax=Peredibacter starrii TaxID=28202 RepID=A0AAX4HMS1_9BACT|nr:ABC transporter ATP-binding protein [Peredibacter starrii]WPU64521.1 ABC transporter ATP-binding protein [Peredibacter starrii]
MSLSSSKNNWLTYIWLKSETPLAIFILVNLVISAITGYLTPKFISSFYESLNNDASFHREMINLVLLFSIEYINRFLFSLGSNRYIQVLLTEIRRRSFALWLKAPFKRKSGKHDEYPLGEVLARLMNDTDAVREVVSSGSFGIFIDIIFILSCLISFLQLNSTTGVALFVAEVIACLLLIKGSKFMAVIFADVRRITGLMARVITDLTSGLKELFFSPNDRYATKRGEKIFEEFLDKQLHANIWDASYYSAAESLYPILVALVMIIVPHSQIVEVAILAALIDLIQKSITPIKDVASKISVIQRARTGIDRLHQFNDSFNQDNLERMDFTHLEAQTMKFDLEYFQYDQGFKLDKIQFEIHRGEILGILGESGCGKSTLLKLLSGQYHTFTGTITMDGKVIDASDEKGLRLFSSYVSLISQDSHVFTETLKFNITLGASEGFDTFWKLACDSIPYLNRWGLKPEDKVIPKALSMGQKQLISGLRALFLKKPVILMDEISSGLDSELEAALRDLIRFFQSRSMTIIVTHRLETILNSHKLILMEEGRIAATGSHQVLRGVAKYQEFLKHLH